MTTTLEQLKAQNEAPEWMTQDSYSTLSKGYLLTGETPRGMWQRCATASANRLKKPELAVKFFDIMWKNWLCLATPIAANMGTSRGLPISCFGMHIPDSIDGIMSSMHETGMLSKHGGGIGTYWGSVRPRGSTIAGNGVSDGIIPFLKILDSTTIGVSQGGTRRGASSAYYGIDGGDWDEFLEMRRPSGDVNRQCLNIHHGACITDEFMNKVIAGPCEERERWKKLLKARYETGEPYMFFTDTANEARPECYKQRGLDVKSSQLCTEIMLHADEDHTFVCCLSSLNAVRWDEWKNSDAVQLSIWFLDGVMEEFIAKTEGLPGFERARRFSVKSRALGLGILGFHSLLQSKMMPIDSLSAYLINKMMFKHMRLEAEKATTALAQEFGEPEWCQGHNRRNTHLLAVAPTVSNALISGVSAGIEPIAGNAFAQKTAKGTFLQKNKYLEPVLENYGKNTDDVWKSIVVNEGSVQQLSFLSDEEKATFLTAREINQFAMIKLAAARQPFICQGQSLNFFFPSNVDPEYFNQVHIEAWKQKLLSVYYCRTSSVLKGDSGSREYNKLSGDSTATVEVAAYRRDVTECAMCDG